MLTPVIGTNNLPTGAYTYGGKPYSGKVNRLYTQGNLLKGGDMIWQNTVADSVIDDNDRIGLGNAQPKFITGLSNSFTYKGFTLSFNFYVSWGAKLYNKAKADMNRVVTVNVTPHWGLYSGCLVQSGRCYTMVHGPKQWNGKFKRIEQLIPGRCFFHPFEEPATQLCIAWKLGQKNQVKVHQRFCLRKQFAYMDKLFLV